MKMVLGPIVSDVRGRFGGLVASNWKGIALIRKFRAPANPNTANQQEVRNIFRSLSRSYVQMSSEVRSAWTSFATGKPFIARNAYIGRNVPVLKGEVDAGNLFGTPGDASTLQPVLMSVTPGATQLTVALTEPALPTGWTIQAGVAAVFEDRDYSAAPLPTGTAFQWVEAEDVASPYSIVITPLVTARLYQVRGFLRWLAPDGSVRYSASLSATGLPT